MAIGPVHHRRNGEAAGEGGGGGGGSGRIGTSIGGAEQGGDFIRDGAFAISSAMSSSTRPASVSENPRPSNTARRLSSVLRFG
ncbi:hypothetical protein CSC33_1060 [Pseudomonas aeruginosa]|nr:hypothetical protein CSC33_1060 [Pseudomonas aeruginosa]